MNRGDTDVYSPVPGMLNAQIANFSSWLAWS